MRSISLCLFSWTMLGTLSAVQPLLAQSPIWGRAILPQPFDKGPFHQVQTPSWVEGTLGIGYTLSGMDEAARRRAIDAGLTISELGFVDPFYVYYDSKNLKKRSPHVAADHVDREVANYRRLGLRILAVYPPGLQSEVYAEHPDWRRVTDPSGAVPSVDLTVQPFGGPLCLLGPYGEFMIDILAEIVEKYRVDAFSFDGLHYGGVCYCHHCQTAFQADAGRPIPPVDMDDPLFRKYQHWADRRMENLIQRMQARLKGIHPDVALLTWTTNAGRYGHFRDIPRNMPSRMNLLLDGPDQEFWMDETNRGATIVPAFGAAYAWAVTNHRVAFSEPYLMSRGNPYGKDSFPSHEVLRRVLLVATHGPRPSLAVAQPSPLQEAAYVALREVAKRGEWMQNRQPLPWAAMVMSDNTRVFYGRRPGDVEARYLAHVFGAFRTVIEEHLPMTIINDWNLIEDDLAPYKVLILPNTACLSEAQALAVRRFVEQGGGLVTSLDTSLCDEYGEPRDRLLLEDVLGVRHRGAIPAQANVPIELDANFAKGLTPEYWANRRDSFELRVKADAPLRNELFNQLVGNEVLNFKGPAVRVDAMNADQVVATLKPRDVADAPEYPAIVARSFGKGRVVFLAVGLDAAIFSYGYPYQRELLGQAIRYVAASPPPIEVDAPMCVHAACYRQIKEGKERILVHLFNDVNTTACHGRTEDDVPLREEILPIHDIQVRVRSKKLGRVMQEPEHRELDTRSAGDEQIVIVPKLDIHSIIVIDA